MPRVGQELSYMPTDFTKIGGHPRLSGNSGGNFGLGHDLRNPLAAIDGGMIFIGFGLFLFAFHLMGGMFRFNRQTIPLFIGAFGALAMFYGLLWIWADRQTVGMRWTGLRLIDFDGFPADRRARSLRAVGACLSFCAGGLGLLWALADEEKLAWHDHMSKTFPTIEESNRSFFQKRP